MVCLGSIILAAAIPALTFAITWDTFYTFLSTILAVLLKLKYACVFSLSTMVRSAFMALGLPWSYFCWFRPVTSLLEGRRSLLEMPSWVKV